ncbi:MAG: hypothetical protein Q8N98_01055, partial [bacterium]|nr:hypothetical protein [bacterium]
MKIIKKIGPAIFFIFFFLLSYRKFFLSPGTLGHNWDWVFPNLSVFFANFNRLNLYTWNTFNLGEISHLTLSHLIPASLFTFLSGFVSPHWLELGFLLAVHVASFLSFKRFLTFISGYSSSLHFLPAFLYAFSPFLFNDIIGGSYVMWLSYGFLPLYFTSLINFIREGKNKNLVVLTVVSVFVIVSLQHFVLINAVAVAYLAWERIFGEIKKPLPVIIKRFLFFAGVEILTNLYWLLPLGYSLVDFTKGAVLKDSGMYEFDSVRFSQQSLWNIFNLAGYLDRNMYLFSLPEALKILFPVATGFLWLIIFYALTKKGNFKKSGSFCFWLFLFLLTAFLVKGGNRPFPDATLWLYQHLPFMRMFRSPQHLMALPAFILPVLLSFALFYFPQKKILAAVFFAL